MTQQTQSGAFAMLSLGQSLMGGWLNRYTQKQDFKIAQAQHAYSLRVGAANNAMLNQQAEIENRLRAGQNRIIRAQAAAENAMRQISNKRILYRTQLEHEQASENFVRTQESLVQGGLEAQIQAAEQRGAFAASSALSGTLGTTIEGMEQTLQLKQTRADEYRIRQGQYATYDQLRQMAGITPAGISQVDTTQTIPMLDYGYSFSQARPLGPDKLPKPNIAGNFFTDAWGWALDNKDGFRQAAGTVSSWFTPKPANYGFLPSGSADDPYSF